jgi:O-antigen/teichoic acid export membrane protein
MGIGYVIQMVKLACVAAIVALVSTQAVAALWAAVIGLTVYLLLLAFAIRGPSVGSGGR